MPAEPSTTPTPSDRDAERRAGLRRMKLVSTSLLVLAAVIFSVAFALQDSYPWLGYVRASAEGAMVGALADWFAVTALFRHPLGLPIPHTAIIPSRKDDIGESLGEFVETNFLSEDVVSARLGTVDITGGLARWLSDETNAQRVGSELSGALSGVIDLLDDNAMRDVLEHVVRTHVLEPEWAPPLGRLGEKILSSGAQHELLTLLLDRLDSWLAAHPNALGNVVSDRLPTWVPSFVDRMVDNKTHTELRRLIGDVRNDPHHKLRYALDTWLSEVMVKLQTDPRMIARVEHAKESAFDDPRIRDLAETAWAATKQAAHSALGDSNSALRSRATTALRSAAEQLASNPEALRALNERILSAIIHLVAGYRHDLASVITETVRGWDAEETTRKIETQVGRDLQFIRINGTVVGALAGLAIYAVATLLSGAL